jgi:hypothetical protein
MEEQLTSLKGRILRPLCGFIRKFRLRSSNMMVFRWLYCGNFPHITPRGFT